MELLLKVIADSLVPDTCDISIVNRTVIVGNGDNGGFKFEIDPQVRLPHF